MVNSPQIHDLFILAAETAPHLRAFLEALHGIVVAVVTEDYHGPTCGYQVCMYIYMYSYMSISLSISL